jgi:hypothetical protein
MAALNAADLLRVWEVGRTQHPLERSLMLVAAVCPDLSEDEIAALPLGRRDAALFDLRDQTFGRQLSGYTACVRCGERLEFALDTAALRRRLLAEAAPPEDTVREGEYEMQLRRLDSRDLAAAAAADGVQAARSLLARRCVVRASEAGQPRDADDLPGWMLERLAEYLAACDPLADVQLAMSCPTCGGSWQAPLDIGAFVWLEVTAAARRLLDEVHALALAYGWREADVLAMTATRRQAYLELVGA